MQNLGRLLFAIGMLLIGSSQAATQKVDLEPAEFKAAILSKIPPYIQWPEAAFTNSTNRIVVAILGNDPVAALLQAILKNAKFEGRDAQLIILDPGQPIPKCQILFVPAAAVPAWKMLRKETDPIGLLTVGESEDFLKLGGIMSIMNLSMPDRKLWIHRPNAKKASIEINSQLLNISKVIN